VSESNEAPPRWPYQLRQQARPRIQVDAASRRSTLSRTWFAVISLPSSRPSRYGSSKRVCLGAPGKGFGLLHILKKLARGKSTAFRALLLQNIALYGRPSVDVLQANDVVLVELAKGYLKDPHRSVARG
jgi:hypothetical protein